MGSEAHATADVEIGAAFSGAYLSLAEPGWAPYSGMNTGMCAETHLSLQVIRYTNLKKLAAGFRHP